MLDVDNNVQFKTLHEEGPSNMQSGCQSKQVSFVKVAKFAAAAEHLSTQPLRLFQWQFKPYFVLTQAFLYV